MFLLSALSLFLSLSSTAFAGVYLDPKEVYLEHFKKNPHSCETLYYGLFADERGVKTSFEEDGKNFVRTVHQDDVLQSLNAANLESVFKERKPQLESLFQTVKSYFEKQARTFHSTHENPDNRRWEDKNLHRKKLNLKNTKLLFFRENPATTIGAQLRYSKPPQMEWGEGWLLRIESKAASVLSLGHEFSHTMDHAPPKIVSCLSERQKFNSYQARDHFSDVGLFTFLISLEKVPFSKEGWLKAFKEYSQSHTVSPQTQIAFNNIITVNSRLLTNMYYDFTHILSRYRSKDDLRFQKMKDLIKNRKIGRFFVELEKLKNDSVRDPLLEAIIKLSLQDESGFIQRVFEQLEKNESSYNGLGTEFMIQFRSRFNDLYFKYGNNVPSGKILKLRLEAKAYADLGVLPSQLSEAIADYYGISMATRYIYEHYPEAERKNAALAILFARPPDYYSKEVAPIFDLVGSKKTNETRVFRILLANKKFRELLGCEFEDGEAPIECEE